MRVAIPFVIAALSAAAASLDVPPAELPAPATAQLARSLAAARAHKQHAWRDTAPVNADGTVNAYIEIPRGERRKWEFDMAVNRLALDRVIAAEIGPYPVNYGFVPQTVSYDGDPFDVLVLGPSLREGGVVRGAVVGVMFMEDEKGLDSKVVLTPLSPEGKHLDELTPGVQRTIGAYFNGYKRLEPGKFSRVPGWGGLASGTAYLRTTHSFFLRCRGVTGACTVPLPALGDPAR